MPETYDNGNGSFKHEIIIADMAAMNVNYQVVISPFHQNVICPIITAPFCLDVIYPIIAVPFII